MAPDLMLERVVEYEHRTRLPAHALGAHPHAALVYGGRGRVQRQLHAQPMADRTAVRRDGAIADHARDKPRTDRTATNLPQGGRERVMPAGRDGAGHAAARGRGDLVVCLVEKPTQRRRKLAVEGLRVVNQPPIDALPVAEACGAE